MGMKLKSFKTNIDAKLGISLGRADPTIGAWTSFLLVHSISHPCLYFCVSVCLLVFLVVFLVVVVVAVVVVVVAAFAALLYLLCEGPYFTAGQ